MNTKPETEIVPVLDQTVQEIPCTLELPPQEADKIDDIIVDEQEEKWAEGDRTAEDNKLEKDLKMEALTKEFYAIGEEIMRLNNWGELKVTMGQPVEKSEDDFVDELVQLPQDMLHNVLKKLSMKAFKQLSEVEQNQLKQQAATEIEQEAKKEKRKAIKLKKKIKKIKETKNIFVKGPYHKSKR
jgi:hypothetical protein